MLEKQERIGAIILILVTVCLISAYTVLESAGKEQFASAFTNASAEGELVVLSGVIEDMGVTATGGHGVLTVSGVQVFVPGGLEKDLKASDNISLIGTVQKYRGKKEIVVNSADDIKI